MVYTPREAEGELRKPGRIPGYTKPNLPFETLWDKYLEGIPSKAAQIRRRNLERLGDNPRFGRPVTYVDELVKRVVEIAG